MLDGVERRELRAVLRNAPASATVMWPIAYAVVLLVGEVLVTFVNPLLVFPVDGGLVVAISLHLAWLARGPVEPDESQAPDRDSLEAARAVVQDSRSVPGTIHVPGEKLTLRARADAGPEGWLVGSLIAEPEVGDLAFATAGSRPYVPAGRPLGTARSRALAPLLLAFAIAPLIRLISLTLPLAEIEPAYRYFFAGVPMALGGLLVARTLGLRPEEIGIVWRKSRFQVLAVVGSLGLGLAEFTILRPAPMGALPWTLAGLLPAVSVGIFTGFPEEVIFRGVLQTAARPIMGRGTVLYAATVFALLHIGYGSVTDLVFVFAVGLFYGWIFERSRSIVGVSIGHGLANVLLFFVAPYLMPMLTGRPLL